MDYILSPFVVATKGLESAIDYIRQGEPSPYLSGNYAPVTEELKEENCHVVEGQIPLEISGVFLRNGPNPKFIPSGLYHWFDGDGMVHSMHIDGGRADYSNHQIRTKKVLQDIAHGSPQLYLLGDIRGPLGLIKMGLCALRGRLDSSVDIHLMDKAAGTANTAFVYHNRTLMALVESSQPMELFVSENDSQVQTLGANDYDGKLHHPFTAHPRVCPFTGEMMCFGYRFDRKPYVSYSVISKDGKLVSTMDVGISKPVMMHDFVITRNYSIFFDCPLRFTPQNLLGKDGQPLGFDTRAAARIGILPRHATSKKEVRWFGIDNCMVFHMGNAYEEVTNGETVVTVQGCSYPDVNMDNLTGHLNRLYQWRISLESGTVEERPIGNVGGEFPTINPKYELQKHRYMYMATYTDLTATPKFTGVVKVDVDTGETLAEVAYGEECYGGEMVFVSKDNEESEDDGYLAGFVYKELEQKSEFWILCAKTLQRLCRVNISARIPYGFHSMWLNRDQVRGQRVRSKL